MTRLFIEPGAQVVEHPCADCGRVFQWVTAFVYRDGDADAIYYASCYHHDGHEVWIDATFSTTWADGVDYRVSFGCRVGAIEGHDGPPASLVPAGAFSDSDNFGRRFTRDDALAHPQLSEFWELVDDVLDHDPVVYSHVYG
jgi:hypothetical protein